MKKIKCFLTGCMLAAATCFCAPLQAQDAQAQTNDRTGYTNNNNSDDNGVSPWWGLLGLAGLFGLMRKKTEMHYTKSTTPH